MKRQVKTREVGGIRNKKMKLSEKTRSIQKIYEKNSNQANNINF